MPWISTEQKERGHSKPVRGRYAKSAQAHRQANRQELKSALSRLIVVAILLAAAYACVLYLLLAS